uniref:Uncharacterized protein n=1 Tax=Vespula pensylvanica TaxID=30213 RepID=A0A834KD75_VESPE|nr:hypothetical protein H0235_015104 [Vespula pensylvanica]
MKDISLKLAWGIPTGRLPGYGDDDGVGDDDDDDDDDDGGGGGGDGDGGDGDGGGGGGGDGGRRRRERVFPLLVKTLNGNLQIVDPTKSFPSSDSPSSPVCAPRSDS